MRRVSLHPPFLKGLYYGYIYTSGLLNAIAIHPTFNLHITKTVALIIGNYSFWRQRISDGCTRNLGFCCDAAARVALVMTEVFRI